MWISKKRLIDNWAKAVALGYKRGYLAGQIEAMNRIWAVAHRIGLDTQLFLKLHDELMEAKAQNPVDTEIEAILRKAEEEGKL